MEWFIDFQGYKLNKNDFIIKELVNTSLDGNVHQQLLFKPPHDVNLLSQKERNLVKRQNRDFNVIDWNIGLTEYSDLQRILNNLNGIIYVRGWFKKNIIQTLIRSNNEIAAVINLEEYECPPFDALSYLIKYDRTCPYNHTKNCSLKNVALMMAWWMETSKYLNILNLINKSIAKCIELNNTLPDEETLKYLPKSYIIERYSSQMELLLSTLPARLKYDEDIQMQLRCTKHYDWRNKNGNDDWDGPNPQRKNCRLCNDCKNMKL